MGRVREDHAAAHGRPPLPGHPIWADAWLDFPEADRMDWTTKKIRVPRRGTRPEVDVSLPKRPSAVTSPASVESRTTCGRTTTCLPATSRRPSRGLTTGASTPTGSPPPAGSRSGRHRRRSLLWDTVIAPAPVGQPGQEAHLPARSRGDHPDVDRRTAASADCPHARLRASRAYRTPSCSPTSRPLRRTRRWETV